MHLLEYGCLIEFLRYIQTCTTGEYSQNHPSPGFLNSWRKMSLFSEADTPSLVYFNPNS